MRCKVQELKKKDLHRGLRSRQSPYVAGKAERDEGGERLLDVSEAATLLGVRPRTLYQWAYKRRIPVVKLFGRHGALRFRLQDVEKLIQDSLRPAMRPTEAASK